MCQMVRHYSKEIDRFAESAATTYFSHRGGIRTVEAWFTDIQYEITRELYKLSVRFMHAVTLEGQPVGT
jgi:hypothetical protein